MRLEIRDRPIVTIRAPKPPPRPGSRPGVLAAGLIVAIRAPRAPSASGRPPGRASPTSPESTVCWRRRAGSGLRRKGFDQVERATVWVPRCVRDRPVVATPPLVCVRLKSVDSGFVVEAKSRAASFRCGVADPGNVETGHDIE